MASRDFFAFLLFVLPSMLADGYPKDIPDTPFTTGVAGSQSNHRTDNDNVGAGYPPVSMDYDSRYRGPVAMLMVLPDGHIADTDAVTAARAAHLAALDKAKALWVKGSAMGDQGGMRSGGSHAGGAFGGDGGYSYPQPSTNSLGGEAGGSQSYLPPQGISGGSSGQVMGGSPASSGEGGYSYPQPNTNSLGGEEGGSQSYLPPQGISGESSGQVMGGSPASSGEGGYSYPQPSTNSLGGGTGGSQSYLPPQGISGGSSGQAKGGSPASSGEGGYSYPQPNTNSLGRQAGGGQSYLPPQESGGHTQGGSVASVGKIPVSMDYDSRYSGPVAMLLVLPDGHIADTDEVTAARAAHLAALDKAKALWVKGSAIGDQGGMGSGGSLAGGALGGDGGYSYPHPSTNSVSGEIGSGQSYLPPQGIHGKSQGGSADSASGMSSYNGPLAMPVVLPSGYLADTPDNAALRVAHISALIKAQDAWKPQLGKHH